MGYQDNMHLEDIKSHDQDNLDVILKRRANRRYFKSANKAVKASGQMVANALKKHSIYLKKAMSQGTIEEAGEYVQKTMNEKHVRVEQRMEYTGEDAWRCGIYVYKDNELSDFIGAPRKIEGLIVDQRYYIVTTIKP